MQRFIEDATEKRTPLPEAFSSDLKYHVIELKGTRTTGKRRVVGSLADTILPTSLGDTCSSSTMCYEGFQNMELASSRSLYVLNTDQCDGLRMLHSEISSGPPSQISMPTTCWSYPSVLIQGKIVGSNKSRARASSIVGINCKSDLFGPPLMSIVENYSSLIDPTSNLLRPTLIDAILVHRPVIEGRSCSFCTSCCILVQVSPKDVRIGKATSAISLKWEVFITLYQHKWSSAD